MPRLESVVIRQHIIDNRITKIASHLDADGVSSAVLAYFALKHNYPRAKINISFEGSFNEVEMADGSLAELVLDKVPPEDFQGYCIDHHPHPDIPKYELYTSNKPASLNVLEVFKNDIPKKEQWKACVGAVGDIQPEMIPHYIWLENPFLLEEIQYSYRKYSYLKIAGAPAWRKISSPINMCCRAGKSKLAFNRLATAKEPLDLLKDPEIKKISIDVYKEIKRVEKEANIVDLGYIVLWEIDSVMNLTGLMSARLSDVAKKTAGVINVSNGHISLRGILCSLIKAKLSDYSIGGHPKAMGGELPADKSPDDFRIDLRKIFRK